MQQLHNISIGNIKEYERNNKSHPKDQIDLLEQTIEKYWFTNPILLNKENVIIAGWEKEIECLNRELDLTEILKDKE